MNTITLMILTGIGLAGLIIFFWLCIAVGICWMFSKMKPENPLEIEDFE